MAKTKAQLETELRVRIMSEIINAVGASMDTDILSVGASELAIPCLDSEGNEKFVKIVVSVPRGERDGQGGYIPYDGYAEHDAYIEACESKAQERAVKKAMKEADKGKHKKGAKE